MIKENIPNYGPGWALVKLNRIIFPFLWKNKKDLVARAVVIQFRSWGGFGVVATHLKSQALLIQWIKRFWATSYGWRLFFVYWTQYVFRASPGEVLASPFSFNLKRLPPFHAAVLDAWRAVYGHASADLSHLFIGGPTAQVPVSNVTCKSFYDLVLGDNSRSPFFGTLYWPATWKQVHIMSLDRPVTDLCWRVSYGVLHTAERLVWFGYNIVPNCLCGHPLETLYHLLFLCPLAQSVISWVQSLLFRAAPLAPTLTIRHLLFGFYNDELLVVPLVFVYLLNVLKFQIWFMRNNHRYRQVPPGAVGLIAATKSRLRSDLLLLAKRFLSSRRRRYFKRQWGASGAIGRFHNGRFNVII